MNSQWTKWRKSFPILRRVVMGLVILPPLVALPKVTPRISAPKVTEVNKKPVSVSVSVSVSANSKNKKKKTSLR